jgi:hypothetical protein
VRRLYTNTSTAAHVMKNSRSSVRGRVEIPGVGEMVSF